MHTMSHFIQLVAAEQHCSSAVGEGCQDAPESSSGGSVETREGLIQHDETRSTEQRTSHAQLACLTSGQAAGLATPQWQQPEVVADGARVSGLL